MKLTVLILFLGMMQVSANLYSQTANLTLDMVNMRVVDVLEEIEKQTEYRFAYSSEYIDLNRRVTFGVRDKNIDKTLDLLFNGTDIQHEIDDRYIMLYPEGMKKESFLSQQRSVSGQVSDDQGEPLPGVSVAVKGTSRGTITNDNGEFSIARVTSDDILIFSFIGMGTQEIAVENKAIINVTMKMDAIGIEEVVAVGYGTMKKSDLTGSIVSIRADEISKMPTARIDEALQGKIAGVVISQDKSQPGEEPQIRIRGNNSIVGNNDPLIVVDGFIGAQMSTLNPNEIASVEVLKDASATAIYGSRGANGVIIINTKRGETGETQFDFNSYVGFSQPTKTMEMMSAEEHVAFLREVEEGHPIYTLIKGFLELYDPPQYDTDWQDIIFRTGMTQNYHLAARGGTDKTRFAISGSILDQEGIIEKSGFQRQTFRANFDQEVSDRLMFGVNVDLTRSEQNNARVDEPEGSWGKSVTTTALKFPAVLPVYDEEGNYSAAYPPGSSIDNPVALLNEKIYENINFSMRLKTFVEYEIVKGLRFNTSYYYQFTNGLTNRWEGKKLLAAKNTGEAEVTSVNTNYWLTDNILTYKNELGKHALTVMGGFTASGYNSPRITASGNTFPTESLKFYALELAEPATYLINTGFTDNSLASFLGRLNYVYADRYLVTLNFRADGSSKFAKNNKWGYFPSAAVGWRVSEENFMEAVPLISNLKLRASYGETGSQAISPYQSLASYRNVINNLGNGAYTGIQLDNIPNPNLKWETTEQQNFGLDLGLFNNRISIVAEYYIKNTYDLLYNKLIPSYTGYTNQISNIGNVQNKGFELGLNTVNVDREFKWNTSFNISFNRNKVLDLGGDPFKLYDGMGGGSGLGAQTTILQVGEPLGTFYGYIFDGIYQNEEECAALPYPTAEDCEPGMVKLKDIANEDGEPIPDGQITIEDRTIIGNALPDFTFGIGNDFYYKNFSLNVMFQGVYGNDVMNLHKPSLQTVGTQRGLRSMIDSYWDGEGSTNEMQSYYYFDRFGPPSTRFIEDGSYLRLKNLSLGYNFANRFLGNSGINNLRIYVSGQNIWTWTNYSGYDPEQNSNTGSSNENITQGYDYGGYPTAKTYTVGINLTF